MRTALIIVDYQKDFLPGGALGVADGHLCAPTLLAAAKEADLVVFSRDWHPADHSSFSDKPTYQDGSWPAHCVQGTPGAEIDQDLLSDVFDTGKAVIFVDKGVHPELEAYSAFDGGVDDGVAISTLEVVLDDYKIDTVLVGGLALDYCVRATALDAVADSGVRKGYDTKLLVEGTRPVAYQTGVYAIRDLVQAGVELV